MSVDAPRTKPATAFGAEKPTFPVTRPDYTQPPPPTPQEDAAARSVRRRKARLLAIGLLFLAPNILGFLAFTAIPLVLSMVMAFTNWDLKLHNPFALERNPDTAVQFIGLKNFYDLVAQEDFWRYLGNTLFLMLGIPFGIAASLVAALLLSKDLRGGNARNWIFLVAGAVLVGSTMMLTAAGAGGTAMLLLILGLVAGILILGTVGGTTVYRTLFYIPHFTAGVATMILWKKLYNPQSGPINAALRPPLRVLEDAVIAAPAWLVQAGMWVCVLLFVALLAAGLRRLRLYWVDGDVGWAAGMLSVGALLLPVVLGTIWFAPPAFPAAAVIMLLAGLVLVGGWNAYRIATADRTFTSSPANGVGTGLMLASAVMIAMFVLLGFAAVFHRLPAMAAEGLTAPQWLADIDWSKPSLMIMGLWGAVGSNTMLLYLAALTNVPQDLYEAADIDGASRFQKFWNVTWPQLAPTTFFIVVMSGIGGLQGGFEMARVMTQGGPAGSTTTLAYYIYNEGFVTGRLGFSSAVAWTLFLMVLALTLFNWKFGNKYVNE